MVTKVTKKGILTNPFFSVRNVRSVSGTYSADVTVDAQQFLATLQIPSPEVNPWCEFVVDGLVLVNVIVFILNLFLFGKLKGH